MHHGTPLPWACRCQQWQPATRSGPPRPPGHRRSWEQPPRDHRAETPRDSPSSAQPPCRGEAGHPKPTTTVSPGPPPRHACAGEPERPSRTRSAPSGPRSALAAPARRRVCGAAAPPSSPWPPQPRSCRQHPEPPLLGRRAARDDPAGTTRSNRSWARPRSVAPRDLRAERPATQHLSLHRVPVAAAPACLRRRAVILTPAESDGGRRHEREREKEGGPPPPPFGSRGPPPPPRSSRQQRRQGSAGKRVGVAAAMCAPGAAWGATREVGF